MQPYYSNGKLLLTGEYVVLDGALALAVPTKFGQSLTVEPISDKLIKWTSLDYNKTIWYKNTFSFVKGKFNSENDDITSLMLLKVFESIKKLKPTFLNTNKLGVGGDRMFFTSASKKCQIPRAAPFTSG